MEFCLSNFFSIAIVSFVFIFWNELVLFEDDFGFADVFVFEILGLQNVNEAENQYKEKLEETLELLIQMRSDARANKDFELSDKIRIELDEIGIQLKDSKGGTTFKID